VAVFVKIGVNWRQTDERSLLSFDHGKPDDG
jgi:hypothetical protein